MTFSVVPIVEAEFVNFPIGKDWSRFILVQQNRKLVVGTLRGSSWIAHAIRQHTRPRPRDDVLLLNHPIIGSTPPAARP